MKNWIALLALCTGFSSLATEPNPSALPVLWYQMNEKVAQYYGNGELGITALLSFDDKSFTEDCLKQSRLMRMKSNACTLFLKNIAQTNQDLNLPQRLQNLAYSLELGRKLTPEGKRERLAFDYAMAETARLQNLHSEIMNTVTDSLSRWAIHDSQEAVETVLALLKQMRSEISANPSQLFLKAPL